MKKTVIEDSSFELLELFDRVSQEARKEKKAVPAINKMLYYWTRKPLVVGRVVALASTLDNVKDVETLLGMYGDKRTFTHRPDVGLYQKKLGKSPAKIKILDPFAGTGNLMFPAIELGLDVTCSDYNPVAWLIEKATLEFPVSSKNNLVDEFKKLANQIIDETKKEIGRFFTPTHLSYLWLWCIKCPHCSQRIPLTNQMYIVNTKSNKIGIRFTPTKDKNFTFELIKNMINSEGEKFTHQRGKAQCISCGNAVNHESITKDIAKNKDREMIAIQVQKTKGRDYILPTERERERERGHQVFQNKRKRI